MTATASPTITVTDNGPMLWLITFGTIGLWIVHVGAEISLAGYSRTHHWVAWVMNGLTFALAALAAFTTFAAWRIVRRHPQDEGHVSPDGRTAFLGWMGVFIGTADVVLIVLEGIYLVAIRG
jgi:hypothetical protein